jgi:hypothetical protein
MNQTHNNIENNNVNSKILSIKNPSQFEPLAAIQSEYHDIVGNTTNEFLRMAVTAKAVSELKKSLPDDMVNGLAALQNSNLGFRTDKPQGYDIETVRTCLIEAVLRGVKPVGNEFNIIAGRFYVTKEGFEGMMKREQRLNKFRMDMKVPELDANGKRAVVHCKATWEWDGKPDVLECEIPIRVNAGMSDDAILGKAERKLRARVWKQATGDNLTEGEAENVVDISKMKRAKTTVEATFDDGLL